MFLISTKRDPLAFKLAWPKKNNRRNWRNKERKKEATKVCLAKSRGGRQVVDK